MDSVLITISSKYVRSAILRQEQSSETASASDLKDAFPSRRRYVFCYPATSNVVVVVPKYIFVDLPIKSKAIDIFRKADN